MPNTGFQGVVISIDLLTFSGIMTTQRQLSPIVTFDKTKTKPFFQVDKSGLSTLIDGLSIAESWDLSVVVHTQRCGLTFGTPRNGHGRHRGVGSHLPSLTDCGTDAY